MLEASDSLVAEFLKANEHYNTLRKLELATNGRCSSNSLRLGSHEALSKHEEDNAFGSKLEAMASYSSKYDDEASDARRSDRHHKSLTTSRRGDVWTDDDISRLKRAAAKYSGLEKNERWRKVGQKLGRSKRECYDQYKLLKSRLREPSSAPSNKREDELPVSTKMADEDLTLRKLAASADTQATVNKIDGGIGNLNLDDSDEESEGADASGFRIDYGGNQGSTSSRMSDALTLRLAGRGALERDPRVIDVAGRASCRSISIQDAKHIRKLLFGDRRAKFFNSAWKQQGFFFDNTDSLGFGLVQKEGGPCGILAAVQAFILKHILFSSTSSSSSWRNPSRETQESALICSLAEILWRAANGADGEAQNEVVIALRDQHSGRRVGGVESRKSDGITEQLLLYRPAERSLSATRDFIDAHLDAFMDPGGCGVVLFTCSVLLTRSLDSVASDMDAMAESQSLIGRHNYASQELVNLLLCGRAHSNVFDGEQDLGGGMVLRGIPHRGPIGMLTLFEHYEHVRVGSHFKNPEFPIWVLCSESHYSVLFSEDKSCARSPLPNVNLFYYDELGKQDELYRLTLTAPDGKSSSSAPDGRSASEQKEGDLTPPIEHVIRTRWNGANVDWNGSEALL